MATRIGMRRATSRLLWLRMALVVFMVSSCCWSMHRAFVAAPSEQKREGRLSSTSLRAAHGVAVNGAMERRDALRLFLASFAAAAPITALDEAAFAEPTETVVVAGATGQTGRRLVERLASMPGVSVIAGARDIEKAKKSLATSSVQIRGAMVDKVAAVDTKGVELKKLDVVKDSKEDLALSLQGASSLIIATGFVPGNPFAMNAEAKAVDNLGTKALVDAAKAAGVKKVVLVSSILTNGRGWGQENSPGFTITNAFGNVLDEKLEAEKYLRKSGLQWTIVRPGGLKSGEPSGPLIVSGEDTLNTGEISRDLVADVSIAALFDSKAANRVVEIIEAEKAGPQPAKSQWFA